jgi:hypothetical protein
MRTTKQPYRSPLARLQPLSSDIEVIKRDGWQDEHILVVCETDQRLSEFERDCIRRIGNRLYGLKSEVCDE